MTTHLAAEAAAAAAPSDWKRSRFKRVSSLVDTANSTGSLPLLSLSSTGDVYLRTAEADRQIASAQTVLRGWRVSPGDLVVNPMWLVGGGVGVSNRYGAVSPDYRVYSLVDDVEPRFLHHLLRSTAYRDQYRLSARANTTFDRRISRDDFENMPLALPSRSVQSSISTYLDQVTHHVDAIVNAKVRLKALASERAQASAARRVVDLPRTVPLRYCTKVLSGATPPKNRETFWEGSIPWATTKDLVLETIRDTEDHISKEALPWTTVAPKGSILVAVRGMALAKRLPCALVARDMAFNQDLKALVPNAGIDPAYVRLSLAALGPEVIALTDEAAHGTKRLDTDRLVAIRLAIPSLSMQHDIVAAADAERRVFDAVHTRIDRQLALLAEHREALITAAVTGQLDVTRDAPSPPEEALEPA